MVHNHSKLEDFDNRNVGSLPEYRDVANAMRELLTAIQRADLNVTYEQWPDAMRSLAASILFPDWCSRCRTTANPDGDPVYAYRKDDGGMVELGYTHDCGNAWTCHYNLDHFVD